MQTESEKTLEERRVEALERLAANALWLAQSVAEINARQKSKDNARAKLGSR